jgi:anti-sigma factor (TIGR02949 family)
MKSKTGPCRQVVQKMYLILEGDKSESLCESLRVHLDHCESCTRQYKVLEDLVSLCGRFRSEEIPEDQKRQMKKKLLKSLSSTDR